MKSIYLIKIYLLSVLLLLTGCGGGSDNTVDATYEVPEQTNDGWVSAHASEVGIKVDDLSHLANSLQKNLFPRTDSFLVIKDGFLVQELYFNGFNRDKVHDLRSATKSITSALVGIAIDQEYIKDVNQSVFSSITGYSEINNWVDEKNDIQVKHLLTMSSGLACDDSDYSSPGNEEYMYHQKDWVKYILDLHLTSKPGSKWAYCTGGVVSLGAIIEDSSGIQTEDFASTFLFEPLGISNYHWEFTPSRRVDTGGHIHMTPRDMAKIGQLFLQQGQWNKQQVISKQWVNQSIATQILTNQKYQYGYLWWHGRIGTHNFYYAGGNGGQYITILPSLNMVVVSTGHNYNSDLSSQFFILLKNVIDAVL